MPDLRLHPMFRDPIESDRCPDCGTPGYATRHIGPLVEMRCPVCDDGEEV